MGLPRFQAAHGASSSSASVSRRSAVDSLSVRWASNACRMDANSSAPVLGASSSKPCSDTAAERAIRGQSPPATSATASRGSQQSLARSFSPSTSGGLAVRTASRLSMAKRASLLTSSAKALASVWRIFTVRSPVSLRRRRRGILRSARVSAILPIPHSALAPQTLNRVGMWSSPTQRIT
ncbi:hypothetical protein D3C75_931320 [compost metagenome]